MKPNIPALVLAFFTYIALPFLLVVFIMFGILFPNVPFLYGLSKSFGSIAFLLLLTVMSVKALAVIASPHQNNTIVAKALPVLRFLSAQRRPLGVSTFYFAAAHTVGIVIASGFSVSFTNSGMLAGAVGAFALLIGAVTSNNFSLKRLKKHWKKVQMASYVALLATLVHVAVLENAEIPMVVIGVLYIVLKWQERRIIKGIKR